MQRPGSTCINRSAQIAKQARKCERHGDSSPECVCYTCNNDLLCYNCLASGVHKGHNFVKLSDFVKTKKQNIGQLIKEARDKEITINSELDVAKNIMIKYESKNDIVNAIQNQKEKLISLVTKVADNLQNEAILSINNYTGEVSNYIEQQETYLSELSFFIEKAESDSVTDFEFIEIMDQLAFCTERPDIPCVEDVSLELTENSVNESQIVNLFGKLVSNCKNRADFSPVTYERDMLPTLPYCVDVKPSIINQPPLPCCVDVKPFTTNQSPLPSCVDVKPFTTNQPPLPPRKHHSLAKHDFRELTRVMFPFAVMRVCPVSVNEAWVLHDKHQNSIKKVNTEGEIVEEITLDTDISDMTVTQKGDVLVCCDNDRSIRTIVNQSSEVMFHCEGIPKSICGTDQGDVIISLSDEGVVVKYRRTGHKLNTSNKNGYRQGITRPVKLAVCGRSGRVAVIDKGAPLSVVVLDADLNVVFTYKGDTLTKAGHVVQHWSGEGFHPNDVTFNSEGHLLVADAYDTVVKVDTEGYFDRIAVTVPPVETLIAACLHTSGNLWAGYENGMIKVFIKKM